MGSRLVGWLSALFIAACVVEPTDSGGKDSVGEDSAADTDWLFVAGYTDVNAQIEQWKYGAGLGFDPAYPLLIDTSASGGTLELTTTPPSLVGLAAGWGADVTTGDPQLLYATEGSGAWRGYLTW